MIKLPANATECVKTSYCLGQMILIGTILNTFEKPSFIETASTTVLTLKSNHPNHT
jgi:hypothetical protein